MSATVTTRVRVGSCPTTELGFCRIGGNWRMDETCIKVKGVWTYRYRVVNKEGRAVDFLLTARLDNAVTLLFF